MKIAGIITEYNPFHLGHKLHLEKTKKLTNCDAVVCLMSGHFVQRGAPAIIDKWTRTQMALDNGVDLILELPTVYAVSSAEFFASGAVSILNSLNVIDSIAFGSECGDINLLKQISSILSNESSEFKEAIKKFLNKGYPVAVSRSKAILEIMQNSNLSYDEEYLKKQLNSSNNILGIEYVKALLRLKSNIIPYTLKREGALYNDRELNNDFSSASSIRNYLKATNDVGDLKSHLPKETYDILSKLSSENYDFAFEEKMFSYIKYKILTDPKSLSLIPDASEGLDNKIIKELQNSKNLDELILNCKSKRYTYTRISRILTQFFIGLEKYPIKELRKKQPSAVRILGLNKKGAEILKLIKKESSIEFINKPKKPFNDIYTLDIQASKAYSLLCNNIKTDNEFKQSPLIKMDEV
ncbi:nucleotidyltransferase [Clostridium sp. 'White wine YQ']|uniref:nucleotidyltransferase n=1 Tax=Clostridium sp. 'White wine YQ' TaxID=3027474 RepID=UPI002365EED1|nr:nucleotidyltransferase [Clostridium sp. 'White wine YQ']MDD7793757.1 nucleotidyltransferase [Clostridium sp. 'White wine YQ']